MRSTLALLLLGSMGLVACSSDSFATPTSDAGAEGSVDAAAPGFCAKQPPGYVFCDDFDTLGDGATGLDPAWVFATDNGGVAARSSSSFLSPGFGLETSTTQPGKSSAMLYRNPNVGTAVRLSLSFGVKLSASCMEAGGNGLALPAVTGTTGVSKSFFAALGMTGDAKLVVYGVNQTGDGGGGGTGSKVGTTTWPLETWTRVTFDLELGTKKVAHVSLDGATPEDLKLDAAPDGLLIPGVAVGVSADTGRTNLCTADFDDVVFRVGG